MKAEKYTPTYFSGDEQKQDFFNNSEQLLNIEWIKSFKEHDNFHRFSLIRDKSDSPKHTLMAEYDKGFSWWVVAYIKDKDISGIDDLPEWEAKYKKSEKAKKKKENTDLYKEKMPPCSTEGLFIPPPPPLFGRFTMEQILEFPKDPLESRNDLDGIRDSWKRTNSWKKLSNKTNTNTMQYKDYIDLGFERTDMNDNVRLNETGYKGFYLEKEVNKKIFIGVSDGELDKPKLYIKKKGDGDFCHILPIDTEVVRDLVGSE